MMLQRPEAKLPKVQFTPAQMMALVQMGRVAAPRAYGPAPFKGVPKSYRMVWFGEYADLLHHRPVGITSHGNGRVERVTYKSPIVTAVDLRARKGRPPFNKAREMERRVNQGVNHWNQ